MRFKYSVRMRKYKISFSLGYYLKKEKDSMDYAFKQADSAMYLAKKSKKNWSQEATYDFIKRNRRKKFIEKLIDKSIDVEFYPVFQKKYKLENRKIIGAEALARWYNNFLGQIEPDEFIPVAENLDLIHRIDYMIAAEAIKKTKEILEKNIVDKDFRMSFNISFKTLKREDLVDYIFHLLETYSLNGKNIEIEITESIFSGNIEDITKKLNILRKKGIYISIDNFTVNNSSLELITTLPIDVVKFDKSLITNIGKENEKERKIYLGLTNMIKSLKLKVVAEGIEKKEQLEFLKKIGVNYGQGYYFGNLQRKLMNDD